jgi:RimJ/RimL family protein N-acetyltransferase
MSHAMIGVSLGKEGLASMVELVVVQDPHKLAMQHGLGQLQALIGVSIPVGWPQFPEAFAPSADETPGDDPWPSYFFISRTENCLVGNGGFAGPPDSSGAVEIGYEIAPAFRNRGYATAAVREMLKYAFSTGEVRCVLAHTLAEPNASNAVLKNAGFEFAGEVANPEVGAVWRWHLGRPG